MAKRLEWVEDMVLFDEDDYMTFEQLDELTEGEYSDSSDEMKYELLRDYALFEFKHAFDMIKEIVNEQYNGSFLDVIARSNSRFWNGSQIGYKVLDIEHLNTLSISSIEFSPKENEVTVVSRHHDGSNSVTIRILNQKGSEKMYQEGGNYETLEELDCAPYSRKIDWNKGFKKLGLTLKQKVKPCV